MDNTKLAWLAGIIDGEGSIACYVAVQKNNLVMHNCVAITNSDPDIMAESNRIVTELIGHSVVNYVKDKSAVNYLAWQIQIQNRKDVIKLLTSVEPYLIGKKAQAQLLLTINKNHRKGERITKVEQEAIAILKRMKYEKLVPMSGNAELKQESLDSCKRVEHREATTQQSEMDLELKECAEPPRKGSEHDASEHI